MERMHEIMKERIKADEAFDLYKKAWQNVLNRLDEEMETAGPIKIGDIVVSNDDENNGLKMIVEVVWIINGLSDVGVIGHGRLLEEDGTRGVLSAEYFIEVAVAP